LRKGWSVKEAVHGDRKRVPKAGNPVNFRGMAYDSGKALATAFGIDGHLYWKRINRGWTIEQALDLAPAPPRFRDYDGHARDHRWKEVQTDGTTAFPGTAKGSYRLYVICNKRNGKEYIGITITPLDVRFRNHKANAKKGIKSKLYNAIRRHGSESFEIALLRSDAANYAELQQQEIEAIRDRGTLTNGYNVAKGGSIGTAKSIWIGGNQFISWSSAAEYFGIDPRVFALRLSRLKWTPEQAAEIEPRAKYARHRIDVDGMTFPSLRAACLHFCKDYKKVHQRHIVKGWTLERALEIANP